MAVSPKLKFSTGKCWDGFFNKSMILDVACYMWLVTKQIFRLMYINKCLGFLIIYNAFLDLQPTLYKKSPS